MTVDQIIDAIKALEPADREVAAWRAMDEAGIVLFVGATVADIREHYADDDDNDHCPYTDEQIMEALQAASERDWGNETYAATDLVRGILEEMA